MRLGIPDHFGWAVAVPASADHDEALDEGPSDGACRNDRGRLIEEPAA